MRALVLAFAAVAATLAACEAGPETVPGTGRNVYAGYVDAACGDAAFACTSNDQCVTVYASTAPAGRVYGTCFYGRCRAADHCILTHAGAPDFCSCGDSSPDGCPAGQLCVQLPGASMPACVAACR